MSIPPKAGHSKPLQAGEVFPAALGNASTRLSYGPNIDFTFITGNDILESKITS
jgi:hypothetical protein